MAATFPDIAAYVLRDANCILHLAVTTKVNDCGSVTLLVSDPATPTAAFAPYFDALSSQLNKSFPVGESPWLPFRLASNEAPLAIHSLHIAFLPEDPEELFPYLVDSVRYGASGAPKNVGPWPNSPPRPAEQPGAGRVFLGFRAPAAGPARSPDGSPLKQVGRNGAPSRE